MSDQITFCTVVEAEGFSSAAQQLGCSQALVSKRIKQLEKRMGAQLINRSTRGFSLTESGRLLYSKYKDVAAHLAEAEREVVETISTGSGTYRFAAPLMCTYIGVPNNKRMLEDHPEISVIADIIDGEIDVINGGHDAAIQIGEMRDSNLIQKKAMDARFCVVATPEFVEANGEPKTPDDLARFECLAGIEGGKRQWLFQSRSDNEPYAVEVSGRFSAGHDLVLHRACLMDMGYAQLPLPLIYSDLKEGRLTRVLEDYCYRAHPIYVVYPSHNVTARTREVVDLVIKSLGTLVPDVPPNGAVR